MTSHPPARHVPRWAMRAYTGAIDALRKDPFIFRRLFGFPPPPELEEPLWDWTTLALKCALKEKLIPGQSLLDMGTGPAAVLSIYAHRALQPRRVCAVDHLSDIVGHARHAASFARADIEIFQSNLFSEIKSKFDVIAFNAPYIDAASGTRLSLFRTEFARQRWCGGADGMETIERFLVAAHAHLRPGGFILLGINRFYVREAMIRASLRRAKTRVDETWRNWTSRSAVFLLRPEVPSSEAGRCPKSTHSPAAIPRGATSSIRASSSGVSVVAGSPPEPPLLKIGNPH